MINPQKAKVLEQVAVRTEANADELKFGLHDAVNQDKVGLDVAIAITGVVSRKSMVAQCGRKRLLSAEKINDSSYLLKAFTAPDSIARLCSVRKREISMKGCGATASRHN